MIKLYAWATMSETDGHERKSELTRGRLLEAALVEFSRAGFEGTSTRAIAGRAGCHQPQINYHFASKEALWEAAVDFVFADLYAAMAPVAAVEDPVERFAEGIRRFVQFAARRPELNRIMVAEAMASSSRLAWIVDRHGRAAYEFNIQVWRALRATGRGAPIDERFLHHTLAGAASLLWANAPEAALLDPSFVIDDETVRAHADSLIILFVPDYATPEARPKPQQRKKT
jgi:TetR/AcrR family transcriptional regulator